jgi:hypothetical protein
MQDKKGQEPYNEKGERHGLWILLWSDNSFFTETNYVNGERYGLRSYSNRYSKIIKKEYYAN